jgi:hypothetical protein
MTYKTPKQQPISSLKLKSFPDSSVDKQATAQVELDNHIKGQAQAIAPEEIRVIEISFYDHQIYAAKTLIARITHDDNDFVTQRWVVMVNGAEVFRADTWAKCHSHITWHYKQGTLPMQVTEVPVPTGNEVMAQIAATCEEFGFELGDDGIYQNNQKLGEVSCTDGRWWVVRVSSEHQERVACDSAADAVWSLSMVKASLSIDADTKLVSYEDLLDKPCDELTIQEWERLRDYQPLNQSRELVAA